jgi:hypothetical protein
VVKERVGGDYMSQEKAAHGHVVYAVQEVSKTASKGAQNGSYCPGNERCAVVLTVTLIICSRNRRTLWYYPSTTSANFPFDHDILFVMGRINLLRVTLASHRSSANSLPSTRLIMAYNRGSRSIHMLDSFTDVFIS